MPVAACLQYMPRATHLSDTTILLLPNEAPVTSLLMIDALYAAVSYWINALQQRYWQAVSCTFRHLVGTNRDHVRI